MQAIVTKIEVEEDGCKDLIIEAKFQALAFEVPVDAGYFFVFPDRVRRADTACYLRDFRVVDGASDDLVEGRNWTCERTCRDRASLVMKTVCRTCVCKDMPRSEIRQPPLETQDFSSDCHGRLPLESLSHFVFCLARYSGGQDRSRPHERAMTTARE